MNEKTDYQKVAYMVSELNAYRNKHEKRRAAAKQARLARRKNRK